MARLVLLNMPIGDLADMSTRVKNALVTGEHFAVEDTRAFRETLGALGISSEGKRIQSLHDHSSEAKWGRLLEVVEAGNDLYVCSEAGSPVLSDPAFPLVRLAQEKKIEVTTYSGISAVMAALELSGLPPLPFTFHGFLPRDEGKIRQALGQLGQGTHIFFEAPVRVRDTLLQATAAWPDAEFAVVKEITKPYQKAIRFRGSQAQTALDGLVERGEFVWLVHHSEDPRPKVASDISALAGEILMNGVGNKLVSKLVGAILSRPAKEIYAQLGQGAKRD
jgi:16S rRNA (cytidine1402-2'-O)-methyltransferase